MIGFLCLNICFNHCNAAVFLFVHISICFSERIGHLQPFGTGPSLQIDEFDGFPDPTTFYNEYLLKLKPLKMKGAAKDFPASTLWNDDYFLNMNLSKWKKNTVLVETKKKEDRKQPVKHMNFQDFIRSYNHSELYMVQVIPEFLKSDVLMPWPLQCESWKDGISQIITWISSGGTKSVIHTDSASNINCVIRGDKTLVFVDPNKFPDRVPLLKEGTYSPIDVDRVDFDKYPSMDGLEYYHVKVTAGDCLFIPYQWIHQVRSYNRNIAVNVWFDSSAIRSPPSQCSAKFDTTWTLQRADQLGMEMTYFRSNLYENIKKSSPYTMEDFIHHTLNEINSPVAAGNLIPLYEMFEHLDLNKNLLLEATEIQEASLEVLVNISKLVQELFSSLQNTEDSSEIDALIPKKNEL